MKKILVLSDIHGNFPALAAVAGFLDPAGFDLIVNAGDSTVYAPFANQVLDWLRRHQVISILGNTDRKVIRLLRGKTFKKPSRPDKRVMYDHTAQTLTAANSRFLRTMKKKTILEMDGLRLGIYHGSPARTNEFLFADTPDTRFRELARSTDCEIIITGHSHTPYCKRIDSVLFINPGSVGRMFDGDPRASCAVIETGTRQVHHLRLAYDVEAVVREIERQDLPPLYRRMYRLGRKLN